MMPLTPLKTGIFDVYIYRDLPETFAVERSHPKHPTYAKSIHLVKRHLVVRVKGLKINLLPGLKHSSA